MNRPTRVNVSVPLMLLVALALLLGGAGLGYLLRQNSDSHPAVSADAADRPPSPPTDASVHDGHAAEVVIPISKELADRAGIEVARVSTGFAGSTLRIPGVVEPDAYKQVLVTPVAGGRVIRVATEVGAHVRRGQSLAQIYSPELAEAQTRLIALRAEFDAAERQVNRTRRLVEIGAASRQELEQVHAEHAGHAAALAGARSRLILLGMSPGAADALSEGSEIDATLTVPAPLEGIVTERMANAGLNVDASTPLFRVVDLRSVWVIGDLYERDFPRVTVGDAATVSTAPYPDLRLEGRVSYIDPSVNAQTRTARVRVEVGNPRQELRLGMLAQIQVRAAAAASALMVPREAVQTIAQQQVVYVADPANPSRFIERAVQIGDSVGEQVEVLGGLNQGDLVVTKGSFFVRAERERLGSGSGTSIPR
jgi:RND family efflux transporter MFP subunit